MNPLRFLFRIAPLILGLVFFIARCHPVARPPSAWSDTHHIRLTRRPVISSPVAWDFDGDGIKEIAVGSWDGYFYLLDAYLQDLPGWPKYSPRGFFSSPALADLNGDGIPEILVGSEAGLLFAWTFDGRNAPGFPVDFGYPIWASPTVFQGPGMEIRIAIGDKGRMHVLDAYGRSVPGWPQPLQGWPDATAATEGTLLAVTTLTPGNPSQGWLYAWTVAGDLLPGFPLELPLDADSSPALAELDGDDERWIIFGDDAGFLHVVNKAGRARPGFPIRSAGPEPGLPTPTPHPPGGNIHSIEASPAVADLTGDGHYEIVVGSWDGRLYVVDDAGRALPGWPIRVGDQIISSAALVDLTGDDRLDIVVGSKDTYLYGWSVTGAALPGFPIYLGAPVFSSPWIGDLEGDGQADIVVGANNGIHVLRRVGPLGRSAWPMFHANEGRTGWSIP